MDKWDILLIRACKAGKNPCRFRRILQKRADFRGHIPCSFVAEKLWAIVQKYDPPNSVIDLLNDFSPEMAWRFNAGAKEESDYWTRIVNVLSSRIALMEGAKLTGYIPHAAFRNWQKNQKAS
jgi:hypothetical protein